MSLHLTPLKADVMRQSTPAKSRQGGYATLGIAAILLAILSLMTIYLTKSGIIDIRTSASKARYSQALANAEKKLEVGLGWMSQSANRATLTPDTWVLCSTFTTLKVQALGATWRCHIPPTYTYTVNAVGPVTETADFVIATPDAADAIGLTYTIVAEGTSEDASSSAVVKQGVYFYSSGGAGDAPPMMGTGNVPLNGNFTVVANPNSGGTGVPVSIWSKAVIDVPSGSAATCQLGEYTLAGGNCSAGSKISSSAGKGADIVDNSATFPDDVFKYIFGVPTDSYGTVKAQATVLTNCNNLGALTAAGLTGIVWVTGACDISSGTTIGSATSPIQLVVESGDFTMRANSTFYGMLVSFGLPPGPNYNAGTINANGGAKFYGSMVSNDATSMGVIINGTFDMLYSQSVSDVFKSPKNPQFKVMTRIPGSWADFL